MRILFTHTYFLQLDPKQWAIAQPYPPLGTLYAAAVAREQGHSVELLDTQFAGSPDIIQASLEKTSPDCLVICDDGFNYLTKMCLTNMRDAAFRMLSIAKQYNCPVIVSSSDATDHYGEYIEKGADFVLIGEPENTLAALLSALTEVSPDLEKIPGLVYRSKTQEVSKTAPRQVNRHLDDLPVPAWDLLDITPYRTMWVRHHGYFSMNIVTTRGCPYKCNWCAKPIYGNRYNVRTPGHVVSEIRLIREMFHPDHLWFCDDIFGLKPGWVESFARLMLQEGLSIPFKIQARADLLVQTGYAYWLSMAGCTNVWMGAESGSQKILDAMQKGITLEQIAEATRLLKAHHIKPSFFLQFGYPGETRKDIQATIRMVKQLIPHSIGISVSYPLPGTLFYENVSSELKNKANWTDSDDLALLFTNTYRPDYYKQLHTYVHLLHRISLLQESFRNFFKPPFHIPNGVLKKMTALLYYEATIFIARLKLLKLAKKTVT